MSDAIRIITEPYVSVVVRPFMDKIAVAQYLESYHPDRSLIFGFSSDAEGYDGDAIPEVAGRICYQSFKTPRPGGNAAYLDHIKEVGHGSVLEHASWSFLLAGISRSLSHELVRHRIGVAISQESQRYVDESDVAFVLPPAIKKGTDEFEEWAAVCGTTLEAYRWLSERLTAKAPAELSGTERRKWARQAARSALPNAAETRIFWTANGRALRHMIEQRASRHADVEIRRLFVAILKVMQREAPHLFGDYELVELPDGTQEAVTKYRKV